MHLRAGFATIALLAIVACGSPESPTVAPPAVGPADQGENRPDWDFSRAPVTGASLSFSPDPTDFCTGTLQKVTVHWQLPDGYNLAQIWAQTGSAPKLFAAIRGATGEVETGTWVRQSTVFHLVDASTGTVLVQAGPTAMSCS